PAEHGQKTGNLLPRHRPPNPPSIRKHQRRPSAMPATRVRGWVAIYKVRSYHGPLEKAALEAIVRDSNR
ncbi:hypothetical protein K432DRAFT_224473, partial [Lepidopterella palustris CBS 459.81]